MKIYALEAEDGTALSFHATKKEAKKEQASWEDIGETPEIYVENFTPNRKEIVLLLERYRQTI